MTRPLGFYWVKRLNDWTIAEWVGGEPHAHRWILKSDMPLLCDDDFEEVGDLILPPKLARA